MRSPRWCRLAAGAFTARRVVALRDTVTAQATALAGDVAALARSGGEVDFMAEFAYPLPIRISARCSASRWPTTSGSASGPRR